MIKTHLLAVCLLSAAACGKTDSAASKGETPPPAAKTGEPAVQTVKPPVFVPCDATAITALRTDLNKANGIEVDLSDKALEKEREAMKSQLTGKRYAFKGCTFSSQGNDEVEFGAQGTDVTLDCQMKGGEAGVTEFRNAAMKVEDVKKLRLDVSGVIALDGPERNDAPSPRLQLTDCQISSHE